MKSIIPQSFVADLLARVDIVEIIDARVRLKSNGKNYSTCCPFHQEKTPSFVVFPRNQNFHCFGCGKSGDVINFLRDFEHLSYVEAVTTLAHHVGVEVPVEAGDDKSYKEQMADFELLQKISDYYHANLSKNNPNAADAISYLKNRGITGEIAKEFELGLAMDGWENIVKIFGTSSEKLQQLEKIGVIAKNRKGNYYDLFRNRLIIPIKNRVGKAIAFGARTLGSDKPKYLNSPETKFFHKSHELFALDIAKKNGNSVIVVEGYMDVIALRQYGIKNVVATLGTAVTEFHLQQLYKHFREIYFCFDGDAAGAKAGFRTLDHLLSQMEDGRQAYFFFMPQQHDPDSLVREIGAGNFRNKLAESQPLSEYLFSCLKRQVNDSSLDGKIYLAKLALPYLQKIPGVLYQQLMLERLAALTTINVDALKQQLQPPNAVSRNKAVPSASKGAFYPAATTSLQPLPLAKRALALILLQSELALKLKDYDWLQQINLPELELLSILKDKIDLHENIEKDAVLEYLQQQVSKNDIERMVKFAATVPITGIIGEFDEIMRCVHKRWIEHKYSLLLVKAKSEQLTIEDKAQMMNLLQQLQGL